MATKTLTPDALAHPQSTAGLSRRQAIAVTIAAVPAIMTLTAGPVSAAGPSNQPSPGCESLPPGTPGCPI